MQREKSINFMSLYVNTYHYRLTVLRDDQDSKRGSSLANKRSNKLLQSLEIYDPARWVINYCL